MMGLLSGRYKIVQVAALMKEVSLKPLRVKPRDS